MRQTAKVPLLMRKQIAVVCQIVTCVAPVFYRVLVLSSFYLTLVIKFSPIHEDAVAHEITTVELLISSIYSTYAYPARGLSGNATKSGQ